MAIHRKHFLDTLNTKIFTSCVLTLRTGFAHEAVEVFRDPAESRLQYFFFFFTSEKNLMIVFSNLNQKAVFI